MDRRLARVARVAGPVVLVAVAVGLVWFTVAGWRYDSDLQRDGEHADVPVVSVDHENPKEPRAYVQMPDGELAGIDGRDGRVGDRVKVVYWPDDQADAEIAGWPSRDAVVVAGLAGFACLLALSAVSKTWLERWVLDRIVHWPRTAAVTVPQPPGRTTEREARARRAKRTARRARATRRRR
jgi:hypothetical protein